MAYKGRERRRFNVVVTSNREYHLRNNRCVGVRHIGNDLWDEEHTAVGKQLVGCLNADEGVRVYLGRPSVGDRLCFSNNLVTSPVRAERRPDVSDVRRY